MPRSNSSNPISAYSFDADHSKCSFLAERDGEMRAICEKIHDGPVQELTAAMHMCETLRMDLSDPAHAAVASRIADIVGRAAEQLRLLLDHIDYPELDATSLNLGLERLSHSARDGLGVNCDFDPRSNVKLASPAMAQELYQAAKDAIDLAITHIGARAVNIRMEQINGKAVLSFELDSDEVRAVERAAQSPQWRRMGHRARRLRADLEIRGDADEPSVIRLTFDPSADIESGGA